MIVAPMIFQTLSFGWIMKHLLANNSNYAVLFAGVMLLVAALATLRIKSGPAPVHRAVTPPNLH